MFNDSGYADTFKNLKYVDREEDLELKAQSEAEKKKFDELSQRMYGQVDGELDMDLHGNITFRQPGTKHGDISKKEEPKTGIDEAGTYILRGGKLVKGQAEIREQAQYSNWYCSNADPEDIRRHRELMDRMHYRGPKWEGIGVPKTLMEEENPVYRPREQEEHPSMAATDEEGHKEFEHVVR